MKIGNSSTIMSNLAGGAGASSTGGAYVPPHRRRQRQQGGSEQNNAAPPPPPAAAAAEGGRSGTAADDDDDERENLQLLEQAFSTIRCINLERRTDRWEDFQRRLERVFGCRTASGGGSSSSAASESSPSSPPGRPFASQVERFNAVDGSSVLAAASGGDSQHNGEVELEWDATNNALWDRHIQPPYAGRKLSVGEVGCALSHVKLWRELAAADGEPDDKTNRPMLILEDDADFFQRRPHHQHQHHHRHRYHSNDRREGGCDGDDYERQHHRQHAKKHRQQQRDENRTFPELFADYWKQLPSEPDDGGWDIAYLGFSDRGERIPVVGTEAAAAAGGPPAEPHLVEVFRPTYGFHTHAYAITAGAAKVLLSQLPVVGPLDVWLADNNWFGLKVFVGVVKNAGWNNTGAPLIGQCQKGRKESDIAQSGRHDDR